MNIGPDNVMSVYDKTSTHLNGYNKGFTTFVATDTFANTHVVNLQRNKLTSLPNLSLFLVLVNLDCSNNNLTALDGLSTLRSLKTLDCRNNCISSLDGIEHCSALHSVKCGSNPLESVDCVFSVPNLSFLDMSNTNVRMVYVVPAGKMHRLNTTNTSLPENLQGEWEFVNIRGDGKTTKEFFDRLACHCRRREAISILGVAKKKRWMRDVLGLVARVVWKCPAKIKNVRGA